MRSVDAPSTRAASISSSGSASRRYWVIQNTPKALTSAGRMTAQRPPIQPSLATMKSGTTPSCVGTHIVAMTKMSSASRPRNRSLAKANPASVDRSTTATATTVDTMTLLRKARQNGSVVTTVRAFSMKLPPGRSETSPLLIAAASLPPMKDHQSGKALASRTTMRKAYAAGLACARRATLAVLPLRGVRLRRVRPPGSVA